MKFHIKKLKSFNIDVLSIQSTNFICKYKGCRIYFFTEYYGTFIRIKHNIPHKLNYRYNQNYHLKYVKMDYNLEKLIRFIKKMCRSILCNEDKN